METDTLHPCRVSITISFAFFWKKSDDCNNSKNSDRFVDKLIFISVLDELKKLY